MSILMHILISTFIVSISLVEAKTINKTFFMPRPDGVNLGMRLTPSGAWMRVEKGRVSRNYINISPFFQASTSDGMLARHFLFGNAAEVTLRNELAAGAAPLELYETGLRDYLHDAHDTINAQTRATVALEPEVRSWGLRFDLHYDLSMILYGFFFQATMPVVHKEHRLGLTTSSAGDALGADVLGSPAYAGDALASYLQGSFANTTAHNRTQALTHARLVSRQTETGVADIDMRFGFKFAPRKTNMIIAFGMTIPTGTQADATTLFQPIVGNGRHFGMGVDVSAGGNLFTFGPHQFRFAADMRYRYVYKAAEVRTLGFNGPDGDPLKFSQYVLVQKDNAAAGAALIPAANLLTRRVTVFPRAQIDAVVRGSYVYKNFALDLFYNLFAREREFINTKNRFNDVKYHVPDYTFNTTRVFDVSQPRNVWLGLTKDTINSTTAATGAQVTHSIGAGASYIVDAKDKQLMLGLGGKYEFSGNRSSLEQWSLWTKIGAGF